MIETLDNRFRDRDYLVELGAPEFTSICPMTGGPDFVHEETANARGGMTTRVVARAGALPESWTSA